MTRKMLILAAIGLAAPAFAQTTPDPMANQSGAVTTGQPAMTNVMDHSQHDVAAPVNASPTQTTPQDMDGDTDSQMPVEGTMAIDTTGRTMTDSVATTPTGATGTYAGVGGPLEGTTYPVCTREIMDNCMQMPRSPSPR